MQIQVVKSKIHRVKCTGAELNYIPGPRTSGEITLNGAAARKVSVGDTLILITYAFMDIENAKVFKPSLVFPDEATNLLK